MSVFTVDYFFKTDASRALDVFGADQGVVSFVYDLNAAVIGSSSPFGQQLVAIGEPVVSVAFELGNLFIDDFTGEGGLLPSSSFSSSLIGGGFFEEAFGSTSFGVDGNERVNVTLGGVFPGSEGDLERFNTLGDFFNPTTLELFVRSENFSGSDSGLAFGELESESAIFGELTGISINGLDAIDISEVPLGGSVGYLMSALLCMAVVKKLVRHF